MSSRCGLIVCHLPEYSTGIHAWRHLQVLTIYRSAKVRPCNTCKHIRLLETFLTITSIAPTTLTGGGRSQPSPTPLEQHVDISCSHCLLAGVKTDRPKRPVNKNDFLPFHTNRGNTTTPGCTCHILDRSRPRSSRSDLCKSRAMRTDPTRQS